MNSERTAVQFVGAFTLPPCTSVGTVDDDPIFWDATNDVNIVENNNNPKTFFKLNKLHIERLMIKFSLEVLCDDKHDNILAKKKLFIDYVFLYASLVNREFG